MARSTRSYASATIPPHCATSIARGINSEIATPIIIDDIAWGMVWASTRPARHPLTSRSRSRRCACRRAGRAGRRAHRTAGRSRKRSALRDPLTRLGNRRVLDEKLRSIFRKNPLDRQDCALIMCDVDELKIVNDTPRPRRGRRACCSTRHERYAARSPVSTQSRSAASAATSSASCSSGGSATRASRRRSRGAARRPRRAPPFGVVRYRDRRRVHREPSQLLRAADVAQIRTESGPAGRRAIECRIRGSAAPGAPDLISYT
jgi:hypothetical protein